MTRILLFLLLIPSIVLADMRSGALDVTTLTVDEIEADPSLPISAGGSTVATFDSAGLYIQGTGNKLSMTDESGNEHDVLDINASGDTRLLAPAGELVGLSAGTTQVALGSVAFGPVPSNTVSLGASNQAWTQLVVTSPDDSVSVCGVDNSDNWSCTGL